MYTHIIILLAFHSRAGDIPFNRRCGIYSGFHFLLAHYVPPFEHVKDKCAINQQYLKAVDLHFVKSA